MYCRVPYAVLWNRTYSVKIVTFLYMFFSIFWSSEILVQNRIRKCCGSGIRCFFEPLDPGSGSGILSTLDPGWKNRIRDKHPVSATLESGDPIEARSGTTYRNWLYVQTHKNKAYREELSALILVGWIRIQPGGQKWPKNRKKLRNSMFSSAWMFSCGLNAFL